MRTVLCRFAAGILLIGLPACATSDLVSADMEAQIARDISFEDVKASPEKFKDQLIVLGGYVLAVRTATDHVEIEVLQLPLDRSDKPIRDSMKSKGRFLAFSKDMIPNGKIPQGSSLSMIAQVLGRRTALLDDRTYTYPTFAIKFYKVWPKPPQYVRPFPFWDRWTYPFDDPWTYPYWGAY